MTKLMIVKSSVGNIFGHVNLALLILFSFWSSFRNEKQEGLCQSIYGPYGIEGMEARDSFVLVGHKSS